MPMDNVMNSVNQYETPNVINFNSMQNSVSPFNLSANNLQYVDSPKHMPMDRTIDHVNTSCLSNYSQPSHAIPYVTNFSVPYASGDIHNSATHLHNGYSRIYENSVQDHMSSSNTVACHTSRTKVQNFGNTQVSLPKNNERSEGWSSKKWDEDLVKEVLEGIAIRANHQEKVESVNTTNLAQVGLNSTHAESNQYREIDTSVMTDLVEAELGEAKSDTHDEFVKVVDTSFVEQKHGKCETMVLDFSGCKGPFMLPYEFRAI
jgi:hypothetical protein